MSIVDRRAEQLGREAATEWLAGQRPATECPWNLTSGDVIEGRHAAYWWRGFMSEVPELGVDNSHPAP